ncbi:hypothetical protein [Bifidobacterium pseudolongum]|uniref:hypothetical protein n=1 Tax=Bifidobacterium pseudolongum TaxID=1694 RepID=UPI00209ED325|nr:hypothetical protein [Bifidobacterium pseudolongum]
MPEPEEDGKGTATVEEPKGAETDATNKPDVDDGTNEPDDTAQDDDTNFESDLEHWKRMSRENEKAFKKTSRKLEAAEGQLAEAKLKITRMELQREHPELDDSLIDDMFTGSTSEELQAWVEKALKHFTKANPKTEEKDESAEDDKPEERKPVPHRNPDSGLARAAAGIARQPSGSSSSKPRKGETYERKMKEFEEQRKRLAGK